MTQVPNQPSAEDVLMGSGARAASFKEIGAVAGGKVTATPGTYEVTELIWVTDHYVKGDLKKYPSGDQIYGISVLVQTNAREDQEDDGVRCIYVQGKRMLDAVRSAVREAGAARLEQGGELWVKFTGLGEPANPEAKPPKEWAAKYTAPAAVAQDAAWGPPTAAPAQPATPPPAAAQPPPQAPAADNPWGQPAPAQGGGFPDEPPF